MPPKKVGGAIAVVDEDNMEQLETYVNKVYNSAQSATTLEQLLQLPEEYLSQQLFQLKQVYNNWNASTMQADRRRRLTDKYINALCLFVRKQVQQCGSLTFEYSTQQLLFPTETNELVNAARKIESEKDLDKFNKTLLQIANMRSDKTQGNIMPLRVQDIDERCRPASTERRFEEEVSITRLPTNPALSTALIPNESIINALKNNMPLTEDQKEKMNVWIAHLIRRKPDTQQEALATLETLCSKYSVLGVNQILLYNLQNYPTLLDAVKKHMNSEFPLCGVHPLLPAPSTDNYQPGPNIQGMSEHLKGEAQRGSIPASILKPLNVHQVLIDHTAYKRFVYMSAAATSLPEGTRPLESIALMLGEMSFDNAVMTVHALYRVHDHRAINDEAVRVKKLVDSVTDLQICGVLFHEPSVFGVRHMRQLRSLQKVLANNNLIGVTTFGQQNRLWGQSNDNIAVFELSSYLQDILDATGPSDIMMHTVDAEQKLFDAAKQYYKNPTLYETVRLPQDVKTDDRVVNAMRKDVFISNFSRDTLAQLLSGRDLVRINYVPSRAPTADDMMQSFDMVNVRWRPMRMQSSTDKEARERALATQSSWNANNPFLLKYVADALVNSSFTKVPLVLLLRVGDNRVASISGETSMRYFTNFPEFKYDNNANRSALQQTYYDTIVSLMNMPQVRRICDVHLLMYLASGMIIDAFSSADAAQLKQAVLRGTIDARLAEKLCINY